MKKKKPQARVRYIAKCVPCGRRITDSDGNAYHGTLRKAEALVADHFYKKHVEIAEQRVIVQRDVKVTVTEVS